MRALRRQFLFLRVYAIATSLVFIVLAVAAFRQAGTSPESRRDQGRAHQRRGREWHPTDR